MKESNLQEKLIDLLVAESLFGLSDEEAVELTRLKARFPDWREDESLQLTVAAIQLASIKEDSGLPPHLEKSILQSYEANSVGRTNRSQSATEPTSVWDILSSRWLGWATAASMAALLLINILTTAPQTAVVKSLAEERQYFISHSADVKVSSWSEADEKHPLNLSGDIAWSDVEQRGFMRFKGLPVNDKIKECYQLWIFDANQSEKTPVDGGVFNVESDGEVIIPIDAKLKVLNPSLFAVTVEKSGGVVVSSRERIAAIAKVNS